MQELPGYSAFLDTPIFLNTLMLSETLSAPYYLGFFQPLSRSDLPPQF